MDPKSRGVVVGYDGSDFAMQALDWAMDEAELRGVPITVCHAWRLPQREDPGARESLRHAAEHVLWHGAECVRQCTSGAPVHEDLFEGRAGDRLVELSADAELVVVGSRGLRGLARVVAGSVARQVVAHAACPVIVVRGVGSLPQPQRPGPIVAAVAGNDPQVPAFAFREAELRRLPVVAVHAWRFPVEAWSTGLAPLAVSDVPGGQAADLLEAAIEPWRRRFGEVAVRLRPAEGPVREVVAEAARGATMLVVGATRSPGLLGRLGSVALSVIQTAGCPVAVVRS